MTVCPKLEDAVTGQAVSLVGDESFQSADDPRNLPRISLKGWDYAKSLRGYSIAELYFKGRVSVVLELAMKRNLGGSKTEPAQRQGAAFGRSVYALQFHAVNEHEIHNWNKQAMFVVNVEMVDGPNVGVPSFVGFHAIDHEAMEAGVAGYFSFSGESRLKHFPFGVDGEIEELGIEGGGVQSLVGRSPRNIKSAVEIVNCVSNHQGERCANAPMPEPVLEELFPRLRIDVHAQLVSISRDKESLLDIGDVLVGPFDFQDRISVRG